MPSFIKNATISTLLGVFLLPTSAFAYTFATNLRMGDTNADVLALQQLLNKSLDTQVAVTGAGSIGQETTYFGAKTLDAVNRFQTKYRAEILTPSGLTAPTGFVGPATRAQLQKLSVMDTPAISEPTLTTTQPKTAAPALTTADVSKLTAVTLPDMSTRVELYIAEVKKGLKDQGESADTIAQVEAEIRKIALNADKYIEDFYKQEQEFYKKKQAEIGGPVMAFFKNSLPSLSSFFVGETAHAALGLPFGGYVATIMPVCTCVPAVSQIFVFLANPNVAVTNMNLDYVLGTQAFNWHTLPLPGIATLGLYEPTPTCFIGIPPKCVPLPSRGLITPIVGSSLLPPLGV